MKKYLLFFLASALVAINSQAQIRKGSILLGGDINAYSGKQESNSIQVNKSKNLFISPSLGKAVKDNLVLGVDAGLVLSDFGNEPDDIDNVSRAYSLGVFVRKYKTIGKDGFFFFIHGRLGGTYSFYKQLGPGTNKKGSYTSFVGINLNPGAAFAISKRFQVELMLNNLASLTYFSGKNKENGIVLNKTSGIELTTAENIQNSLSVGFRIFLGKVTGS